MSHRRSDNDGYDSLSEKKLAEMFKQRKIDFESHYHLNDHEFDFALFLNGKLKCLIEVDGEYNHGLLNDVDGKHVRGEKDCERFSKVPDGVNFVVVDSSKVTEDNLAEILKSLELDYEAFISNLIASLPKEFPYPTYTEKRMKKDWEHLCTYTWNSGQRLGMSIINNFHKSIWTSHVGNHPSPVEAWNNPELLERCVRNRFIYKSNLSSQNIAQGFNVCKLAPKVSVFNPSLARHLIGKYTPEAKTVIDPFSGFSGRMLGVCSLGMKYTGYDLNETAVKESKEIIKFLGLGASIEREDILKNSGSADVLFTCPPYGSKEIWSGNEQFKECNEWIDICLERFECDTYMFVVDDPGKYKYKVVEILENRSHISSTKEYVILIKRC